MTLPERAIPKIIHQIWIGPPLPRHLQSAMDSWRKHHPEWEYRLWRDDDFGWLKNRNLYEKAEKFVPRHAVEQFQSDLARYEILYHHGGFYVDADAECLRPVDEALRGRTDFAVAERKGIIANGYLASTPAHGVMSDLIKNLPGNAHRNRGKWASKVSGPAYMTPYWRLHKCHVDPTELWLPYSWSDVRNGTVPTSFDEKVYAVHLWNHTRNVIKDGL